MRKSKTEYVEVLVNTHFYIYLLWVIRLPMLTVTLFLEFQQAIGPAKIIWKLDGQA